MKKAASLRDWFLLLCITIFTSAQVFAQDNSSETHTTETHTTTTTGPAISNDWMNNPWVWVGAGVVVLLILIGIFSSRSGSASEIRRTTITRTEVSND